MNHDTLPPEAPPTIPDLDALLDEINRDPDAPNPAPWPDDEA